MNEKDLKEIFKAHRIDIRDEGFSERIIRKLPERRNVLPHIIMVAFIIIGLSFCFIIQGITPIIEQVNSLITSINNLQAPSPSSVITYIVLLGTIGLISYPLVKTEEW